MYERVLAIFSDSSSIVFDCDVQERQLCLQADIQSLKEKLRKQKTSASVASQEQVGYSLVILVRNNVNSSEATEYTCC